MWVSTLSPVFLPSLFHRRPLGCTRRTSILLAPPRSVRLSASSFPAVTFVPLAVFPSASLVLLATAYRRPEPSPGGSAVRRGVAPSFTPVPPDRLKLQSVASPSVGTLIRGRLHCSGTLLAALGYQLFHDALSPSLAPSSTRSPTSYAVIPPRARSRSPSFHLLRFLSHSSHSLLFSFLSDDYVFLFFLLSFSSFLSTFVHPTTLANPLPRTFIGGSPYSWASAPLPDNLRVKLLRPGGIAFARDHGTLSLPLFSLRRAADADRMLPLASGFLVRPTMLIIFRL